MTLIVLTVLAAAWLGYFALWFREKRGSRSFSRDTATAASVYLDQSFVAAGREQLLIPAVASAGSAAYLRESPRSRRQAMRRRRQVCGVLVVAALASLLAVPVAGPTALAVHVMVDVGLILFAFFSLHRQQAPGLRLADVRVLYPDRPAPAAATTAVVMPLKSVVNG